MRIHLRHSFIVFCSYIFWTQVQCYGRVTAVITEGKSTPGSEAKSIKEMVMESIQRVQSKEAAIARNLSGVKETNVGDIEISRLTKDGREECEEKDIEGLGFFQYLVIIAIATSIVRPLFMNKKKEYLYIKKNRLDQKANESNDFLQDQYAMRKRTKQRDGVESTEGDLWILLTSEVEPFKTAAIIKKHFR